MYGPYPLADIPGMLWQASVPVLVILLVVFHIGRMGHRHCAERRPLCPCRVQAPTVREEWRRAIG